MANNLIQGRYVRVDNDTIWDTQGCTHSQFNAAIDLLTREKITYRHEWYCDFETGCEYEIQNRVVVNVCEVGDNCGCFGYGNGEETSHKWNFDNSEIEELYIDDILILDPCEEYCAYPEW